MPPSGVLIPFSRAAISEAFYEHLGMRIGSSEGTPADLGSRERLPTRCDRLWQLFGFGKLG